MKLKEMSFKDIKEYAAKFDVINEYKNEEYISFVNGLKEDKRKNVQGLGIKLEKEIQKIKNEIQRVRAMYDFDKSFGEYKYIAGVDEVGRGPLAGPIVSCAVILDLDVLDDDLILYLNDSKKLNESKREELAKIIKEKAKSYYIAVCDNKEIDEKGIGVCNNKVFIEACTSLKYKPDFVLSDGYLVKGLGIKNEAVIKGDTKSATIAAASIIAKVYRDTLMKEYALKYPNYGFEKNVGYGASKHIEGIKLHGPCEIHRMSFLNNILNN